MQSPFGDWLVVVNGTGSGAVFRRWEWSDFRQSYRTAGQQTLSL